MDLDTPHNPDRPIDADNWSPEVALSRFVSRELSLRRSLLAYRRRLEIIVYAAMEK